MRAVEFLIENQHVYKTGLCDVMALALHDLTDLPLGAWAGIYYDDLFEEDAYEYCHLCVIVSAKNNTWLDVDGLHNSSPNNCYFNNKIKKLVLVPVTVNEAREMFTSEEISPEDIAIAKSLILKDPIFKNYIKDKSVTEWRNVYTINDLEKAPYDSERNKEFHTSDPVKDKWRGPQEGKYLQLMLSGMKPVSVLDLLQDKQRFTPYIKSGKLIKAGTLRKDEWIVTLPGEEWRAKQLQKIWPRLKKARETTQPSAVIGKLHAKIGMLLGIPKEAVRAFVNQFLG